MIQLIETAEMKWCVICNCFFTPRPCNADKQQHCCKTDACKLESKRASNRNWHRKKSVNPQWRRLNVERVLRHRRMVRFGYDVEVVSKSVQLLQRHICELVAVINEVVPLLAALKALLPAIILGKLPGLPATLKMELESTCSRAASSSAKMILQLETVPGLSLLEGDLACCA
jgi:hypothetical protein